MTVEPVPLLEVNDLRIVSRIGRDERLITDNVSLTLAAGETLGIVGESGSGKSITARAIVGLLPGGLAAHGSVRYRGRELLGQGERAMSAIRGREIGLIFQDPFTMLNPLMRCGEQIVEMLRDDAGRRLSRAAKRAEAEKRLAEGTFDLVVLDLRLGSENGLDLLRDLRVRSDLPVIITTGHRRDEIDRVIGLELGADDYLVKPYGLRELLARVRVILRRAEVAPVPARAQDSHRSRFDDWVLDRRRRRLTNPAGADVALSKGEYALLVAFLDAPQRPLSREQLLQATRVHEDVFDRSIDVQILRLRRKLEADPTAPRLIVTERGVGYVFAAPVEKL